MTYKFKKIKKSQKESKRHHRNHFQIKLKNVTIRFKHIQITFQDLLPTSETHLYI